MKLIALVILLVLAASTTSFGDSDGYGCYGDGIIAFEQAFKDNTGLYIISWGKPPGISKRFRIELPRPHGSYLQGIRCERDKVSILMRGVPPLSQTKALTKYMMYITEIALEDRLNPKIISDKPNHYQVWVEHTQRKIEPLDNSTPVVSLPEPNLNLYDCSKKQISLGSDDSGNTYSLVFDDKKTTSNVKDGAGIILHRCETSLVMKNGRGIVVQTLLIADTERKETID